MFANVYSWTSTSDFIFDLFLTHLMPVLPSYRNQSIDLHSKSSVLRNFAKFTGKQLSQRLYFNKVAGLGLFYIFSINCFEIEVINI